MQPQEQAFGTGTAEVFQSAVGNAPVSSGIGAASDLSSVDATSGSPPSVPEPSMGSISASGNSRQQSTVPQSAAAGPVPSQAMAEDPAFAQPVTSTETPPVSSGIGAPKNQVRRFSKNNPANLEVFRREPGAIETFEKNMGLKLIVVDAVDRFMGELAGVTDPEQKRKIIGRLFVEVFQEEAAKLPNAKWLAQGTIYPDVIESAGAKTKKAKTIKSHHNVGGLPDTLHLKLLEPLRGLFKDEVRELGVALGLPAEMVYRHPFPGPGLGVRILGEVKKEYADLLREADAIFIEELRNAGLYDKVSQAFVVFLPVKSVGVMGDGRTYEWVVSLRSVETSDFMTARWSHLPYELLGKVSNRIINEVRGINRVCYDISGKPPATIEWE